jgi:hypothetical protein
MATTSGGNCCFPFDVDTAAMNGFAEPPACDYVSFTENGNCLLQGLLCTPQAECNPVWDIRTSVPPHGIVVSLFFPGQAFSFVFLSLQPVDSGL